MTTQVKISNSVAACNEAPCLIMGGMNVLESLDTALTVGERFKQACDRLGLGYVFKASFDKANRSSVSSFRGPGLDQGLKWLAVIKEKLDVPIITDVHEPAQAAPVAEVADIVQLPAFLARQTDLVTAIAATGRPINVKKPQFLAPPEMKHILTKCRESGNDQVMLCERGSSFGYNNLVVDMLGMDLMKSMAPVIFDATHALQCPGGLAHGAGGRRAQLGPLVRAGLGVGIAGLFLEAHPDPDKAKCDGPCALPLSALDGLLNQVKAVDDVVKSLTPVDTGV